LHIGVYVEVKVSTENPKVSSICVRVLPSAPLATMARAHSTESGDTTEFLSEETLCWNSLTVKSIAASEPSEISTVASTGFGLIPIIKSSTLYAPVLHPDRGKRKEESIKITPSIAVSFFIIFVASEFPSI